MIKLVDISFYMHNHVSLPTDVIERYKTSYAYIPIIQQHLPPVVIQHINFQGQVLQEGIRYQFFKGHNMFWYLPFKTYKFIKNEQPDIVLVQGLKFPWQVIFLRSWLASTCKIMAVHHGELPFTGIKKWLQKIADRCIDAYLFTTIGNAKVWVDGHVIAGSDKCHEVLEAATYFTRKDKKESRDRTGMAGEKIFLWVGRLEANKDPLTVLAGFAQYIHSDPTAQLYMIYQDTHLLEEVQQYMAHNEALKKAVHLMGKVAYEELPYWYSAADHYLSGSHREGSGYALIEAMACGCIPVITDIPPFRKIAGKHGFYYTAGDPASLSQTLQQLTLLDKPALSAAVVQHFNEQLSFKKIAADIWKVCTTITNHPQNS